MTLTNGGNVGIGTTNPTKKLSVLGTIQATEVVVNTGWSDYVFAPDYRLKPLKEIAAYIHANHHLPEIPTETEVKENGVSLGEMQSKLLAKIEELTLHVIQEHERNDRLEQQNAKMQERLARLETRAASLEPSADPGRH
jgi:predicted ribosome quality control (RQC) complex YloA/Tae2 family protein